MGFQECSQLHVRKWVLHSTMVLPYHEGKIQELIVHTYLDRQVRKNLNLEICRQPFKDEVAGPLSLHRSVHLQKETSRRYQGVGMLENVHFPVEMESYVRRTGPKSQYRTRLDTRLSKREIYYPRGASSCRWRLSLDQADAENKQQPYHQATSRQFLQACVFSGKIWSPCQCKLVKPGWLCQQNNDF